MTRRLPVPPDPGPTDTVETHGAAVFRFVVAEHVTATVPTDLLERALHASYSAIAMPDLADTVRERLHDTRRQIIGAITHRLTRDAETVPEGPSVPRTGPPVGPMAPLTPTPVTRPPAASRATVDLRF